jgi:hypothetical protein
MIRPARTATEGDDDMETNDKHKAEAVTLPVVTLDGGTDDPADPYSGRVFEFEGTYSNVLDGGPFVNKYVPFGEGPLAGDQYAEFDAERDVTLARDFIADVLAKFPGRVALSLSVAVAEDTLDAFDAYTMNRYMLGT